MAHQRSPHQRSERAEREKGLGTQAGELRDLVVAYLKQETVVPIKALGRFVALGLAGSVLLSLGLVLASLAVLRALQGETGSTFSGNLSWAPYFLALTASAVVAGLAARAIGAPRRRSAAQHRGR